MTAELRSKPNFPISTPTLTSEASGFGQTAGHSLSSQNACKPIHALLLNTGHERADSDVKIEQTSQEHRHSPNLYAQPNLHKKTMPSPLDPWGPKATTAEIPNAYRAQEVVSKAQKGNTVQIFQKPSSSALSETSHFPCLNLVTSSTGAGFQKMYGINPFLPSTLFTIVFLYI